MNLHDFTEARRWADDYTKTTGGAQTYIAHRLANATPALLKAIDEAHQQCNRLNRELDDTRAQLTAANRHADGTEADLRSARRGLTEYANQTGTTPSGHVLVVTEPGVWELRHPQACYANDPIDCPLFTLMRTAMDTADIPAGQYEVEPNGLWDRALIGDRIDGPAVIASACTHGGDCPIHPQAAGLHNYDDAEATR
ncbi:hypothetical protein ABZ777_32400 [Micromonospora parva]|uniref:hypothetical protein n=1 Tax=Micromonospora parva TaxID=1464048 RepID=UPI0033D4270A